MTFVLNHFRYISASAIFFSYSEHHVGEKRFVFLESICISQQIAWSLPVLLSKHTWRSLTFMEILRKGKEIWDLSKSQNPLLIAHRLILMCDTNFRLWWNITQFEQEFLCVCVYEHYMSKPFVWRNHNGGKM